MSYINNKLTRRVSKLRGKAKQKNIPFNLTFEYLLNIFPISCRCPALNINFEFNNHNKQPTIDRIIPAKGYVIGNVVWVSFLANSIMSTATPDQILKVSKFAKTTYKKYYPQLYGEKNEN